jgi:hypothetical protein
MSLSITNRDHITQQEIDALAGWNSLTEKLVVRFGSDGRGKIETLSKSDFNCWQFFLSFFGMGKLARTKIHLCEVAAHLSRYNWSEGSDSNSAEFGAYTKVCELAHKALISKKDGTLLPRVVTNSCEKSVLFSQFRGLKLLGRHELTFPLMWNQFSEVRHIEAIVRNAFENATVRIEDRDNHQLIDGHLCPSANHIESGRFRILIDQRLS